MKNDIKDFILNNKKVCILFLSCLLLILVFVGLSLENKDKKNNNDIANNSVNISLGLEDNKVIGLLKGTVISAQVPEDVLFKSLVNFIQENNVEGIEDLSVSISSEGILLKAKYTLLNFIKIPAEFTLVPSKENSLLTLSVENVKIMSLKIKIDKIIEKWITANREIEDIVEYNNGKIQVNISKIAPINIENLSLEEGKINMSFKIC